MKSAEAEEGDCDVTRNNNHFADFFTAQKSLGCLNYAADVSAYLGMRK